MTTATPPKAPAGLTIDELAREVGMTVRNLREWHRLGLLPAAAMRGRVGYYGPDVAERIEAIKELHAEGFTLALIARMLEAGGESAPEIMRLARSLRGPSPVGPALLERIHTTMARLGVSPDAVAQTMAQIRGLAEQMAVAFEDLWMEEVWRPFIEAEMPSERFAEIQATADQLRPLTAEAVAALFTLAMDERIESGIARELSGAPQSAVGSRD